MKSRLTYADIDLKVVMDQSVYVRHSIDSLVEEGMLGAILCSLVILLFLGEWRMTLIAVLTIPIAVLAAIIGLYWTGNTINVMTLAGLALAIGPLVDSAIICLENTHRHSGSGRSPRRRRSTAPARSPCRSWSRLAARCWCWRRWRLMPGLGKFLFRPMALAVTFAMIAAYLLSRTFVPALCSLWLRGHAPQPESSTATTTSTAANTRMPPPKSWLGRPVREVGSRSSTSPSPGTSTLLDARARTRGR